MNRYLILLLFFFVSFTVTAAPPVYNVLDYGARGDGKTIDGDAINKAIATAAKAGGGTVYFPAGNYLTYTIRLASNISLYIDQGATIIAAAPVNKAGYDKPEPNPFDKYQDYGHSHWKNSLIYGEGLHDISILGQGLIWGKDLTRSTNVPEGGGNKAISLKLCHNVTIRDVSVLHGGHFAILATGALAHPARPDRVLATGVPPRRRTPAHRTARSDAPGQEDQSLCTTHA